MSKLSLQVVKTLVRLHAILRRMGPLERFMDHTDGQQHQRAASRHRDGKFSERKTLSVIFQSAIHLVLRFILTLLLSDRSIRQAALAWRLDTVASASSRRV